jgi:lipoate-protein ligase A
MENENRYCKFALLSLAKPFSGKGVAKTFQNLQWWHDPVERTGPANMAIDEWLLESAMIPTLRVYRWEPGWGSLGYFIPHKEAAEAFPELHWVRRWTGGGTVDHQDDWTYTLVVPQGETLAETRGAESYSLIHEVLARVLGMEGRRAHLTGGKGRDVYLPCFLNPVSHDLVDDKGSKIAGAGQRRSRRGLLHQGSVSQNPGLKQSKLRTERLAAALAAEPFETQLPPPWLGEDEISRLSRRYESTEWTHRR